MKRSGFSLLIFFVFYFYLQEQFVDDFATWIMFSANSSASSLEQSAHIPARRIGPNGTINRIGCCLQPNHPFAGSNEWFAKFAIVIVTK